MIKYHKTKTLITKDNNNSADAISPNYVYGCYGGCSSYCYMKRYNKDFLYVSQNIDDIEESVNDWVKSKPWPKIPNQQDDKYYMIEIGCNTDIVLHQKHLTDDIKLNFPSFDRPDVSKLEYILIFYDAHSRLNSTFATKYPSLLELDVNHFHKKPRVRISFMPEIYREILEPNTDNFIKRKKSIKRLQDLGWEVHFNFSPVIVYYESWLREYENMFISLSYQDLTNIKSEVIFLTNHPNSMRRATDNQKDIMRFSNEVKNDSGVMRYPIKEKKIYEGQFRNLHNSILKIPIRYIF